jgi:sarcosine oxidase subunit delta
VLDLDLYDRENACDWHLEWWLHVGGCRKLLKVTRHTLTHEIRAVTG